MTQLKTVFFPQQEDEISNRFDTVDFDAHINVKIDSSISHVFNSLTIQGMNTFISYL